MAAHHEGGDVFDGHGELVSQEVAEAGRVQHAGHADDLVVRQAGEFTQRPDHRVERVGDADHESVRRVFGNAFADGLHDFQIDAQEVVAAHARLARHTGGDDADIGAFNGGIVVGTGQLAVLAENRARLGNVQRLALGNAFGNVKQDDIAQFLTRGDMGERAADHAGSDQRNLVSGHGESSSFGMFQCWPAV